MPDFILNGQGFGSVASALLANDFDIGGLRPFIAENNLPYVTMTVNGKPKTVLAYNAPATLRFAEWRMIDQAVMDAVYTTPQRLFADLRRRGDVITIPNGMGKTTYEYQRMTDIGPATTSMDGIRESDSDRPHFDLTGIPLPIVHKDFQFTLRQIQISRNGGAPLDTSMARLSTRKCLEEVEKYTAGSQTFNFGGYNLYGYQNFPSRMTQSLTAPSSANHATTISEILSMKKKLTDKGYQGPYRFYASNAWDLYLDEDYNASTAKTQTFRERILQIEGIQSVDTSYWLSGNAMLLMQDTPDVAQGVVGMDVVTLQWPSNGGMLLNFKVMCILLPLLKADINGVCGIVHGS
jgi:hypothetical protein